MLGYLILAIVWLVQALLTACLFTSYFAGEYGGLFRTEGQTDFALGLFLGLVFPGIAPITIFFMTGFAKHGVRFWRFF